MCSALDHSKGQKKGSGEGGEIGNLILGDGTGDWAQLGVDALFSIENMYMVC